MDRGIPSALLFGFYHAYSTLTLLIANLCLVVRSGPPPATDVIFFDCPVFFTRPALSTHGIMSSMVVESMLTWRKSLPYNRVLGLAPLVSILAASSSSHTSSSPPSPTLQIDKKCSHALSYALILRQGVEPCSIAILSPSREASLGLRGDYTNRYTSEDDVRDDLRHVARDPRPWIAESLGVADLTELMLIAAKLSVWPENSEVGGKQSEASVNRRVEPVSSWEAGSPRPEYGSKQEICVGGSAVDVICRLEL